MAEQAKLLQKNISHVIFGPETFTQEYSQGSDIRFGASKMLISGTVPYVAH
jgi:hypothetical protein